MQFISTEWQSTSTAPLDGDLEICALDFDGIVHSLPFPCHKDGSNWVDRSGKTHADIQPTHWRIWGHPR
ncbi:hypothetical protein CWO91_05200 [Bradyrhizobium genosp. SA-3]|uniref:Uncharacterized protein n=1 Tax=Bradyrhizobium zhanjiangense TaxID=1325107 RepID=A0A4V1KWU5_9BRAD|nr:hypothetical protein [Bradyrhizobium sp. C-145]RXG91725.1 hypothetical protein EAS62_25005 [Bradyrhizobium zhanjiangense]RZN12280.1 hypothetical protein CWO91_05200 [Bradyrhizobium genosp. SA-3]SDJ09169.1 hypothetical protein SAMN05216338_103917 [Bradyrhizobium sp. Rc2d]RXG99493.1 hypothetical protein EAS61_12520 [Bradyrhizobium zhanjiangense]UQR67492.1 hypothetical protein LRP30_20525 [Bradyrhizobium sp. C-145]